MMWRSFFRSVCLFFATGASGNVTKERFVLILLLCSLVPVVRVGIQHQHPTAVGGGGVGGGWAGPLPTPGSLSNSLVRMLSQPWSVHPFPQPGLLLTTQHHWRWGGWGAPPPPPWIIVVVRSPCQENYPADAHPSALKSVLESANPRVDLECTSGCTWSTAWATARLRDSPLPE